MTSTPRAALFKASHFFLKIIRTLGLSSIVDGAVDLLLAQRRTYRGRPRLQEFLEAVVGNPKLPEITKKARLHGPHRFRVSKDLHVK